MVRLKRETGALDPKPQGRRGHGKLAGVQDRACSHLHDYPGTTLDELVVAPRARHRCSTLCGLGSVAASRADKKDLRASAQTRPDVAKDRAVWTTRRQPFMRDHPERLVFIDETALKTNMAKTHGWPPLGDRSIDHAPAGRWTTQTFIAGLRHDDPRNGRHQRCDG